MIIPIKTVWKKGDPYPGEISTGKLRFVFGGGIPNPFGESKKRKFNRSISIAGYDIIIDEATWENGNINIIIDIKNTPGGVGTALPIGLIVAGLITIGIGVIAIELLNRVEKVLELPIIPIVAGVIISFTLPNLIKSFKSR